MSAYDGKANIDNRLKAQAEGVKEYRKKTTIYAVKMDEVFFVQTIEGMMTGNHGDYLAIGIDGELYPIAAAIFEKSYEEVK